MTPQQQRQVEAQKICEGSPIGARQRDLITGLQLAVLFEERDSAAESCLVLQAACDGLRKDRKDLQADVVACREELLAAEKRGDDFADHAQHYIKQRAQAMTDLETTRDTLRDVRAASKHAIELLSDQLKQATADRDRLKQLSENLLTECKQSDTEIERKISERNELRASLEELATVLIHHHMGSAAYRSAMGRAMAILTTTDPTFHAPSHPTG